MAQHRIEKINELIRTEIMSAITSGLKDPRLENKVIGVTRVNTTPDMKYCKVFLSVYGSEEERTQVLEVLEKAKGFIRKRVSTALTTRYSPELTFVYDDSIDNYTHIEELLKEISNDSKA